jgi:ATP-dependent RNA helicase MSS116
MEGQGKPKSTGAHKGRYRRPKKPTAEGSSPKNGSDARKDWPGAGPSRPIGGPNRSTRNNNPQVGDNAPEPQSAPLARAVSTTPMDIDNVVDPNATTTFASLAIHSSLKASIETEFKFETLTPCQAQTIVPLMANQDVHLLSKTGSGKTLAFLIPSISKLLFSGARLGSQVSVLVISPTRELAMQVFSFKR